jgi:hypothetical protein
MPMELMNGVGGVTEAAGAGADDLQPEIHEIAVMTAQPVK